MIDPYDTSNRPTVARCACCAEATGGRRRTFVCFLGAFCLDVCASCEANRSLPALDLHWVIQATRAHGSHLGACREEVIAAIRTAAPRRGHAAPIVLTDELFYHRGRDRAEPGREHLTRQGGVTSRRRDPAAAVIGDALPAGVEMGGRRGVLPVGGRRRAEGMPWAG
jgi:hypothetical protein